MTSAPSRASTWAQRGPAWWRPKSITRMPFKGPLPSVIASLLAPARGGAADRPECSSSSTAPGVNLALHPGHQEDRGWRAGITPARHASRMTHERARGFGGDAASPGGAREPVGHLDVVTVRHPDQRSEPVEGGVGPPFDPPEAQPIVIAAATVQHAPLDVLRRLLRRLHAGGAAHVAHHVGIAVERDEVGLVRGDEPTEPKAGCLERRAHGLPPPMR